jgi:pyruvate kinase
MEAMEYPQLWFTYGPKTDNDRVLEALFRSGATGARLTFSYGTPDLQAERASRLRHAASRAGRSAYVVADLQGEKCRFAKIEGVQEIPVTSGSRVVLTSGAADVSANTKMLPLQLPSYLDTFEPGDIIVEGDGALLLKVIEHSSAGVVCSPSSDGVLHPGRGLMVRKADFKPAAMTEKDRADLRAISATDLFDAVAVSFVSSAADVREARAVLANAKHQPAIIAKIETALGIGNIGTIAVEADGLMAARGDLALSMPWEDLPAAVETLAQAAAAAKRPWILATQLAEGLERFAFPTRAEICDLAHWISRGAHGAMLSYETAFGPRAIDAISCSRTIIDRYRKVDSPARLSDATV